MDTAFPHALLGFLFLFIHYDRLVFLLGAVHEGYSIPACSCWLLLYDRLVLLLDVDASGTLHSRMLSLATALLVHWLLLHDQLVLLLDAAASGTRHSGMLSLERCPFVACCPTLLDDGPPALRRGDRVVYSS